MWHWILEQWINYILEVPLLWVKKGSYFVFGIPNNRLTCMLGQKTLSLSDNMHSFLPYLLNDSQTIRSTIYFSKSLLCVTLICGDWCDWSHFHFIMPVPDKQVLWAQCCFVYSVTGETAIFTAPVGHLVAKNELAFSFRPTEKTNKWAGSMLMFHVDVNIKRLGVCFKNDSFQWFSRLISLQI